MKNKWLYMLPRALGILFAVFISIFALDAFEDGVPFWESLVGFLIHLVPTYIIIAILLIAWKWEWVGGVLFLLAGVVFIVLMRVPDWIAILLISRPPFLIGVLFITSHLYSKRRNT